MIMTLKLKTDILELLDLAKRSYAEENGHELSDSRAAKLCFGHGEFVANLRGWEGGNGGPALKNVLLFETWLRGVVGEREYKKFLNSRQRPAVPEPEPEDDFGD